MKPGALIQARMSSRRLPGKVLADLAGKPLLERVIERVRLARRIEFVAVATSDEPSDDPIAAFCEAREIPCHRGPLDDVLGRMVDAARHWNLDPVVRITGDCPFVSPELIDELVDRMLLENADCASLQGPTLHEGIDPFSRRALEQWHARALRDEEREHLALLPERYPNDVRHVGRAVRTDESPRPGRRLAVDVAGDLARARALYEALGGNASFRSAELIEAVDRLPEPPTGAAHLAARLEAAGIPRLHLYPGGTIMPTLNAWIERGGDYVVARHEQGAGYAALAEARLSGEPRVAMVTSGPGVTNLVTVIADAYYDATPFLAITGQVGTADLQGRAGVRQRGFQEVPTRALCAPIAKAVFCPMSPDELPEMLEEALALTTEGRPGPVVLELPMDVQRSMLSMTPAPSVARPHDDDGAASLPTDRLDELVQWIREAERPLILAGQGVLQAGAQDPLRHLAEREGIPVVTSLLGVGAFPSRHPLSLGYLGHTGTPWANHAVQGCDLLLVVGARLDVRQTGTETSCFAAGARIARIDLDAAELSESRIACDLPIEADAKAALSHLAHSFEVRVDSWVARDEWNRDLKTWRSLPLDEYPAGEGCHPARLLEALDEATRDEPAVIVTGVGHHQQWAARHLSFDAPHRTLLTSGGHGAMGYDLPSAVGACFARPEARVLCIVGDGSFQINAQELGTLAEHGLPAKIVVLDNQRLAMVSQFQKITWGTDPSTGDRPALDFAALAAAHGLPCTRLERMDETTPKQLEAFLDEPGPALLWVRIDPACEVSPMLLGGHAPDDLWTWSDA